MKKVIFGLLSFVLLLSCQKDEVLDSPDNKLIDGTRAQTQKITFDELPNYIIGSFHDEKSYLLKEISNSFGKPDKDIPAYRNVQKNSITYTIALNHLANNKSNNQLFFDNLVVHEFPDGTVAEYIFRYTPEINWYNGDRNIATYSGYITFFTTDGEQLGEIYMKDGQMDSSQGSSKSSSCTTFIHYDTVCIDAGETGGGLCTYYFRRTCSSPDGEPTNGGGDIDWSNDGGDPSWGDGDGSSSGGGDGSAGPGTGGGGPAGPGTTPIIDDDGNLIEEETAVEVSRSTNFMDNDKINCTYERLTDNSSIHEILKDFFGENAPFDVSFNIVDDLNCNDKPNATGCTTPLVNNAYRIDIDGDYINDSGTPTIFLAQTLIHEAFHARLFAEVKKNIDSNISNDIEFKDLYEKYRQHENWSHQIMADAYTDMMQTALKEVHPDLNDNAFLNGYDDNTLWDWNEFYKYVSYRGLDGTVAGDNYFSNAENLYLYESGAEVNSTKNPNCNE